MQNWSIGCYKFIALVLKTLLLWTIPVSATVIYSRQLSIGIVPLDGMCWQTWWHRNLVQEISVVRQILWGYFLTLLIMFVYFTGKLTLLIWSGFRKSSGDDQRMSSSTTCKICSPLSLLQALKKLAPVDAIIFSLETFFATGCSYSGL